MANRRKAFGAAARGDPLVPVYGRLECR